VNLSEELLAQLEKVYELVREFTDQNETPAIAAVLNETELLIEKANLELRKDRP
jgi:hypothetical protein